MNNEIKINVPEGMEIDKENSTFECIKFKPKWIPKRGDIAVVGDDYSSCDQLILIAEYIGPSDLVGFDIKPLALLSSNGLSIYDNSRAYKLTLWVKQEASASEKEQLIKELNKKGYVYDPNDPRIIYKKEKELPKTWEEFCKNNPMIKPNEYFVSTNSTITRGLFLRNTGERIEDIDDNLLPSKEYAEAMFALCKLIQLRDCYNDGWKPDWNISETKYNIYTRCNKLEVGTVGNVSFVLAFKTQKLRDTFLYNFKDLIEQAKLLL